MTLILLALLVCYIDRVMVSVAAIDMQKEFAWSDTEKGWVLSIFFLGYLIMQIGGGILSNRFGAQYVFMLAVGSWSIITLVTPIAAFTSFTVLLMVRFLLGIGEGAAFPCAYRLVTDWMPEQERSRSLRVRIRWQRHGAAGYRILQCAFFTSRRWCNNFFPGIFCYSGKTRKYG